MIELLLVVLIAVISVSVYAYAYYILKFRDDTKHCPPCEPCPVPVPCQTEVDTIVDVPNDDSEITESNESVQPNDTEPTPCPANWAPVCVEGMTYGNACKASKAGHNNWKQGKCNTSPYVGNDENDTNNDTSPDSENTNATNSDENTNDANDDNLNIENGNSTNEDNYNSNSEFKYGDDTELGIGESKQECKIMCNLCRTRNFEHCDEAYGNDCIKCNELNDLNNVSNNPDEVCINKINDIWRNNLGWVPSQAILNHQITYCKAPEISDTQLEQALVQRFERMKRGEEVNWTTIQNENN